VKASHENVWQPTAVQNLVRYAPSGNLFGTTIFDRQEEPVIARNSTGKKAVYADLEVSVSSSSARPNPWEVPAEVQFEVAPNTVTDITDLGTARLRTGHGQG